MRIVIDFQGAHTESRRRGIGRYARNLVRELIASQRNHEFFILVDGFYAHQIQYLRKSLNGILPKNRIIAYRKPFNVGASFVQKDVARVINEIVREDFIASLDPDVILITTLFEGFSGEATTSIGRIPMRAKTGVIFYDLTPLHFENDLLPTHGLRNWYHEKLENFARADLFFAISEATKADGKRFLKLGDDKIVNVSAGPSDVFKRENISPDRCLATRRKRGLDGSYLLYYGGFYPHKNVSRLIEAYALLPADVRRRAPLALVGHASGLLEPLHKAIAACGLGPTEVRFIFDVGDDELVDLIGSATLVVYPSLWEGFGLPVLEAMSLGAPVLCSNVSSMPEVIGRADAMFNPADPREMAAQIERVLGNAAFREELAAYGLLRAAEFSWRKTAERVLDAFEALVPERPGTRLDGEGGSDRKTTNDLQVLEALADDAESQPRMPPQAVIDALCNAMTPTLPRTAITDIARALAANWIPPGPGRLLVDMTHCLGMGTGGIPRTVQCISQSLKEMGGDGLEILPVEIDNLTLVMRESDWVGIDETHNGASVQTERRIIDIRRGDCFLLLTLGHESQYLTELRRRLHEVGGTAMALVYDLLPIQHPEWFAPGVGERHQKYLLSLTSWDGLVAISQAVAQDLASFLAEHVEKDYTPRIDWFHLGYDSLPGQQEVAPLNLPGRPTVLHVSQIYARKGHQQTLWAFEHLWRRGVAVNYAIVGRRGFGTDDVLWQIETHPELGKRLHFFEDASDAMLAQLYQAAAGVIIPSEAEGFGLPLVEAVRLGKPVLCRDLAVFRELVHDGATYFSGPDPENLAACIGQWLNDLSAGQAPLADPTKLPSWREATGRLLEIVRSVAEF